LNISDRSIITPITTATAHAVVVTVEGNAGYNNHLHAIEVGKFRTRRLSYPELFPLFEAFGPRVLAEPEVVTIDTGEEEGLLLVPAVDEIVRLHLVFHRPIEQNSLSITELWQLLHLLHDGN
jgi:hypothetical protein